jgi:hypothetical protein
VRENVVRRVTATVATACVWLLAGCTSTVAGVAVHAPAPADSDGAAVALLDTGSYPTTPNHPFGTAGSVSIGGFFEGQRIAEYVVGPWQVEETLRQLSPEVTSVMNDAALALGFFNDSLPDIAKAHGLIAGFSSERSAEGPGPQRGLWNVVLRFPDPNAAAAASREMAATNPLAGGAPVRPVTIPSKPEAAASAYDVGGGAVIVQSFTAHGPYVLYQSAEANANIRDTSFAERLAGVLVSNALGKQEVTIDRFVPTDPAKLVDLPKDPTGRLLARTLWAPDLHAPASSGVWQPIAALHFEDDPIKSAALFATSGVETVSQMLTKVYQTHNAQGAARVVERFAADTRTVRDVKPTTGVPGLPAATCFVRSTGWAPSTDPPTLRQFAWHFKCIARADRYAFIAYSDNEEDVKQQTAAQFRILAGK